MEFILNSNEQPMVEEMLKLHPEEYCLILLTSTMLQKSIIDASSFNRFLFKSGNIIDYSTHPQGGENKVIKTSILLANEPHKLETSFYRPHAKNGDPRFWILGLKQLQLVQANDTLFFTIKDGRKQISWTLLCSS
ncbi:hypothetical protein [Listeria grandensis]|uniref:hypothetical protein n=1 Tax=Listeria grandensis TaxID=1494963 RepID=UPI00164E5165|nr:hypothetical protein [Listeria grandensis]MBC6316300.1 hypothetical protein [Listeria grandensis]